MNSTAHKITQNGRRHVPVTQNGKKCMTLVVEWKTPSIRPQGALIFSIDGDPGVNNVQDISTGKRTWTTSGRPPFFDVDVLNLPEGAELILHVW